MLFLIEFVLPKMSLNNREFLILKKRERSGRQAGIFKVRLGFGEIERKRGDGDTER
jgi:hypothetical protein